MGNWYRVVKTIKGNRYLYAQRTWREGGHVRTQSRYLGKAGDAGTTGASSGTAQAGLSDTKRYYHAHPRILINSIFQKADVKTSHWRENAYETLSRYARRKKWYSIGRGSKEFAQYPPEGEIWDYE